MRLFALALSLVYVFVIFWCRNKCTSTLEILPSFNTRERDQTRRRGNQTKVLTALLWGLQELISFAVSHLQTHNYAALTLQQLSRVLFSDSDTRISPLTLLHFWKSEIKAWKDFLTGVLLALMMTDIPRSVVTVAWKPNQSLHNPEQFYSQRGKRWGLQEIKKQRKEKYWDEFSRRW